MTIIHFQSTTGARTIQLKLTDKLVLSANQASGGIRVKRDGVIENGTTSDPYTVWADEWVERGRRADIGDQFEVLIDPNGGDAPASGPATNTWHTISETRQWEWTFPSGMPNGIIRIRDVTTGGGIHSVSATLNVQISSV